MDFREKLKNIRCPVLLMVGMQDPITPPEFSDAIASALVGSDVNYLKFPECGHGVVGDEPAEALNSIREFVGDFQT
jgi:proline iminopeptidase